MRRIFLAALVVCCSGALGPRLLAAADKSHPVELADTIVVTANRFGQTEAKSVWPVAALNIETIRRDISLQQTLDGRFGLDLRQSTGDGSISTLSNWGAFARHMLLLYNGRVVKDYSLGGFNLSDFSSDEFDRIEILKGPQSAFYGADAIGGVVNLITKNALVDRFDLTSRVGSFGLHQYRADAAKLFGTIGVGGFAEFAASDNARPNAGVKRSLFGLRSDYLSPSGKHRWSVSARYFSDSVGAPGPEPDPTYVPVYGNRDATSLTDHQTDKDYSFDASYSHQSPSLGDLQLDLFWEKKNLDFRSLYNYQSYYYSYDTTGPTPDSVLNIDSVDVHSLTIYNKRSAGMSGRLQRQVGIITGSAGIDWLSGSLRATSDDKSSGTNLVGPFAPYAYSYANYNYWARGQNQFDTWGAISLSPRSILQLDMSGRLQFVHHRQAQPSYDLGAVVKARSNLRLKFGYGYAFRLPSIADQFADEVFVKGSANLKPETSHSIVTTVEAEAPGGAIAGKLSLFDQSVDELIQYEWDSSIYRSVPHNVSRFRSIGADLSIAIMLPAHHRASWGAVLQKAEQRLNTRYVTAYYVPDFKWRLDIDGAATRKLSYNLNVNYTSDRSIIMYGGTKVIPKVYELGASVAAQISPHFQISLTGYDLTNQKRPDQFGFTLSDKDYPTPGRRFVLQMRAGLK